MDVVTHMQTFVAVVRCGNFSEAARQLGVVPSVVAKRVSQLEAELKSKLFDRTTRRVALTEAGEKLHAKASSVVAQFEELLGSVEGDEAALGGHLKIMAPTSLTMMQLGAVFSEFLRLHPGITMQIALEDRSANPAEGGFDLSISGRAASYEGVVDIPLRPVKPLLCAAPSYLRAQPAIEHPRELPDCACLVFSATGTTWAFQSNRGTLSVDVHARLLADDNQTLLQAAVAGLGLALLPTYIALDAIAAGQLEVVLPDFAPQENWFKAYVPRRRMKVSRVAALLKHLQEAWPLDA
ncbi:LysR family transcriptional regulator [Variovorax sp. YR216]|uniref:LysR family transcriptional regulator n=1 Tax=Variovorax sp. YR216 TaxID=1882828 RepID=UPI000899E14C|nr:LysR family transcriptional regulator [Variovorax sp. YR216]SEB26438.1 transcriptional regulator, LysR family [Variovorax sp. YR216]